MDNARSPYSDAERNSGICLTLGSGQIQLDVDREDTITWRWTTDGEYTTKSAYCIQFEGTFSKLKLTPIWKAKAKPKCRFFVWTLLHKKILVANNLMKRHWPNDPICKLCGNDLETLMHLCKDCAQSLNY
jgi:hypothetical protein